jgi:hypothetical protein
MKDSRLFLWAVIGVLLVLVAVMWLLWLTMREVGIWL